ncbi:5-methylcytosine-specific restriction protein A [Bradyrhizobium sp. USDA 4354]
MIETIGKYSPLGEYLRGESAENIWLSLAQISQIVGGLPAEASKPQFWANAADHHRSRRQNWLEAGYDAFLRFRDGQPGVYFERMRPSARGQPWSRDELLVCVENYRRLILAEERGERLNKTSLRAEAMERGLTSRTTSAYEFRMQNISAVLEELGLRRATGYPPLRNVGSVKSALIELINELWNRKAELEEPTDDESALATRIISARQKLDLACSAPPPGIKDVRRSNSQTERFIRDPNVIAWVLLAAAHNCEVCEEPAPFITTSGDPYLEVHHVRPLSEGGPDTVDNACACCPNCHRRLHFGSDSASVRKRLISRVSRLVDYPTGSKSH